MNKLIIDGKEISLSDETVKNIREQLEDKPWPQIGDVYYLVGRSGGTYDSTYEYDDYDQARIKIGNMFRIRKEAEKENLRRQAMAERWDWIPKIGDYYYTFGGAGLYRETWNNDTFDFFRWTLGMVKKKEEEVEAWKEKYWDAFTIK